MDAYKEGDGHETLDLTTLIAHELGHTQLGREALNLPVLSSHRPEMTPDGHFIIYLNPAPEEEMDEIRAVHDFENPVRSALGLPSRRSYFVPYDVLPPERGK